MEHAAANPFSLLFGKEPSLCISRLKSKDTIQTMFLSSQPSQQIFLLTGVRGSGKTVLLSEITAEFRTKKDWVVVELNPERDMLQQLAAKLCGEQELYQMFRKAKINLTLFGLGIELDRVPPVTDIEIALGKMLEQIKKSGRKVLVTVDEVENNTNMKVFAASFQILIRNDLPLFLLMTGLYENVEDLQNERSMTFLYRAPKMRMEPLSLGAIAVHYKEIFDIEDEQAIRMAQTTRGYPFAFQVLGFLCWDRQVSYQNVLPEFMQYLDEYVYRKIWSELSKKDQFVLYGMAKCGKDRVKDIRDYLHMETNAFNPYRDRLIKKEIVWSAQHGHLSFCLPCFERFVLINYEE